MKSIQYLELWSECTYVAVLMLQKYYVRRKRKIGTILYAFIIESIVRQWLRTGKFPLQFGSCHPLLLPSYFLLFQANDFYRQSHDYHMYTNLLEAICLFLPLLKKPLPFLTYSRECLHFYARVNIKRKVKDRPTLVLSDLTCFLPKHPTMTNSRVFSNSVEHSTRLNISEACLYCPKWIMGLFYIIML